MQHYNVKKQKKGNSIVLLQQKEQIETLMKNVDYSINIEAYIWLRRDLFLIKKELQRINQPQTFMESMWF